MKTTLTIAVLMMSFASAFVFAEGSKVDKSKINVNSKTDKSMAIAIKDSKALIGSVSITGSEVKKSTINVNSKTSKSMAIAIKDSTAAIGSVNID